MEDMNRTFETTLMQAMIEGISHMGSAFGANEKGEAIFFNARLVDKVGLEMGDIVEAHTIPNYEDKRDVTPWRAVRVRVVGKEDLYATQSNSHEQQIKEHLRNVRLRHDGIGVGRSYRGDRGRRCEMPGCGQKLHTCARLCLDRSLTCTLLPFVL